MKACTSAWALGALLCGCSPPEPICELELAIDGIWSTAAAPACELDLYNSHISIESNGVGAGQSSLFLYVEDEEITPGSHSATAAIFHPASGTFIEQISCVATFSAAELENWTINDRFHLAGEVNCSPVFARFEIYTISEEQ